MNNLIEKALSGRSISFDGKSMNEVESDAYPSKLKEMGFDLTMPEKDYYSIEKNILGLVPYDKKVYIYLDLSNIINYPILSNEYFDMLYEYFHKRITILELIDYVKQNNIQ